MSLRTSLKSLISRDPAAPSLSERSAELRGSLSRSAIPATEPRGSAEDQSETDAVLLALASEWEAARDAYAAASQRCSAISDAADSIEPRPSQDLAAGERQRAVQGWRERTGVEDAEGDVDEALDALAQIEDRIAELPAVSLAGLRLKALVAQRNDDIDVEWPNKLGEGIARDLLALTAEADPTDWDAPPPGFMAYPERAPMSFLNIRHGLKLELERLHGIATAEFQRRVQSYRQSATEEAARRYEAMTRAQLFLAPLTAAVDPESDGARALTALDLPAEADPILAAIAASRRAEAEMAEFARSVVGGKMTAAERDREEAIEREQRATRTAAWATVPTTAEGRRALVEYARFQASLVYGATWRTEALNEMIFGDIFLALASAIEAESVIDFGPDGAIVRLAAKFCRVYALHNEIDRAAMAGDVSEEQWQPHYEATMNLARQLAATTPTTMIGMALKCLGPIGQLAWQNNIHDDPKQLDPHERLAIEFYEAFRSGTLSPILPDPSTPTHLTPDRQWAVAQAAAIDLTSLPVLQLHNLFDAFAEAADQWLSLAHQPWADDAADNEFRRPNGAGRIIDREQDRAAEIRTRIAEEIRRRVPATDGEHDWRLETLIRYEIMCEGSLRHAPELRAEIAKAWGG